MSSSETFAKRRAIFLSVRNTVNNQGYSVTGANQNARKLLSTDLVNTNGGYKPRREASRYISTALHRP